MWPLVDAIMTAEAVKVINATLLRGTKAAAISTTSHRDPSLHELAQVLCDDIIAVRNKIFTTRETT